jgi:hypothetical protein
MQLRNPIWLVLGSLVIDGTSAAGPQPPAQGASPASGYTIHVTAPHLYKGKESPPIHHFCKTIAPDPVIVCQLYTSMDPNAPLIGIEYIVAKKLTRPKVPLATWNANFHDHAVEIASGRVKVLDMSQEDAKKTADLVATTDGIIFHLWPDGDAFPTGPVAIDQAVGHRPLTAAEYAASIPGRP